MGDPVRIAAIRDRASQLLGDAEPTISLGEQHDPAIGTDPSAVKGGGDLLVADGWKAERQEKGDRGAGAARRVYWAYFRLLLDRDEAGALAPR
jgi:hypothetical protein